MHLIECFSMGLHNAWKFRDKIKNEKKKYGLKTAPAYK